ncbi:uncharacterized protein LOC123705525 [Colias croceus]|uniref:uncharacterized protein LOC123705525 n=1 Tax=Colias crocea TaxID=72248 RepID=UPI001E27C85D|nr:uncharacterized protein LOC123705525 [Colias croceus]
MDKKKSAFTTPKQAKTISKFDKSKKAKGDCFDSKSSSHTQFFAKEEHGEKFNKITKDEYFHIPESISGSSDTFHCVHGPEGKLYTEDGLLKRNLLKELDPIPLDRNWNDQCPPAKGWDMVRMLEFMVLDPVAGEQIERLEAHLRDFARTTSGGFLIDSLNSVCLIMDFLITNLPQKPQLREGLTLLLRNVEKPILLLVASDVIKYFETLQNYFGFLGYLLMQIQDDDLFDLVSKGLLWQLSAPDALRGNGAAQLRHTLSAAGPFLYVTIVRMLAISTSHRFPTFLQMALLLACDSVDNCISMMKENIIENIFYRFNPYFPERALPDYDINPLNPQDINVKLGDSSIHMSNTLSLLLILLKTTLDFLNRNPKQRLLLPSPDNYAQKCFVWAFRYECRAREHRHERITLTVIATALFKCFSERLTACSSLIMLDVMSLAVFTEVPPRRDWTRTVNFNTGQLDVQFKKILIFFSVDLIKYYPYNQFMIESQYWLLGLMYMIDPGLSCLRAKWSTALFSELRKTALQALVCTIPLMPPKVIRRYGLIMRIMWYVEWYSENPYELSVLYWCLRVLQVSIHNRNINTRRESIQDLFDTHGIIILMHLCYTLLEQKTPPVEKSQAIIAICLRLLTSAVELNAKISCCVYPDIKWPITIGRLARKMLNDILFALDKHLIINEKWMIALLNFIWEGIVWKKEYRAFFVSQNGVYKLLDLITLTRAPIQCITMAVICDIARSGEAVGQLITWRANIGASNTYPNVVKRGSTIATLLAAIFRDECLATGVRLNEYGVLENLEYPLLSTTLRNILYGDDLASDPTVCYTAVDMAGSRMSKAYALLQLLSEDLANKVNIADETYNLYKNIKLTPEDETILVLCSHYLTIKLNECWYETKVRSQGYLPHDETVLSEFLHICKGWNKEIKQMQEDVIEKDRIKELEDESSLYAFLARVRLNIALDALNEVRCVARSADRAQLTHAMLHDAVRAHHRRYTAAKALQTVVLRTYGPTLDDQNITGQYVKVYSIYPKNKPRPKEDYSSA